jgi:hypothetical protein
VRSLAIGTLVLVFRLVDGGLGNKDGRLLTRQLSHVSSIPHPRQSPQHGEDRCLAVKQELWMVGGVQIT